MEIYHLVTGEDPHCLHFALFALFIFQDIFVTICKLDNDRYFMCNIDEFKFFASMIEHVPLPLRARYVFACAPIPKSQPFVCTMLLKVCCRFYFCIALSCLLELVDF